MSFYGLVLNAEFNGNLLIKIALSDIIEDVCLSRGKWGDEIFRLTSPGEFLKLVQYLFRHIWSGSEAFIYGMLAARYTPNYIDELVSRNLFVQVSGGLGF